MIKKTMLMFAMILVFAVAVSAQCEDVSYTLNNIIDTGDCYSRVDIHIKKPSCGYNPCFKEFKNLSLELDTGLTKRLFVPRNSPASLFVNGLDCSKGKPTTITLNLDAEEYRCSHTFDLVNKGEFLGEEVVDFTKEESEKEIVKRQPSKKVSEYWIGLGVILIIVIAGLIVYLLVFYEKKPKYRLYRYK